MVGAGLEKPSIEFLQICSAQPLWNEWTVCRVFGPALQALAEGAPMEKG